MSILFFHKSLEDAKKDIDQEKIEEARKILRDHHGDVDKAQNDEKRAFFHLLEMNKVFLADLKEAETALGTNNESAKASIDKAINHGRDIIRWAREVIKLAKEERGDVP